MPTAKRLNAAMADVLMANMNNATYKYMNEPVGDFGVWNGQFETGPGVLAEGWEFYPEVGGVVQRQDTIGGSAGRWCCEGGAAGVGQGGTILGLRYFCIDEFKDYYLAASFLADNAAATVELGMRCYNSGKVLLGDVWGLSAFAPGTQQFDARRLNIGPNGDATWWAAGGTRYARVLIRLQWNAALGNAHTYVDDVQFSQLKKTYSPLIRLVNDQVTNTVEQTFTLAGPTLYPGSALALTLEEPGYIWYKFNLMYHRNTTAVRVLSHYFQVFVDGVAEPAFPASWWGSAVIGILMAMHIGARSQSILSRGLHTIDLRIVLNNPGDNILCRYLVVSAFYVRAY